MLQAVEVRKDSKDLGKIRAVYEETFPENEKVPFDFILDNFAAEGDDYELLAVYDGALFVGFVIIISAGDISFIVYFAVDAKLRSKGYGSKILQAVHAKKPQQRFVADVEKPDSKCDNFEQREKRMQFYYRNGYEKTEIEYDWQNENYVVLSYNGKVTQKDYKAFWKQKADILKKAEAAAIELPTK